MQYRPIGPGILSRYSVNTHAWGPAQAYWLINSRGGARGICSFQTSLCDINAKFENHKLKGLMTIIFTISPSSEYACWINFQIENQKHIEINYVQNVLICLLKKWDFYAGMSTPGKHTSSWEPEALSRKASIYPAQNRSPLLFNEEVGTWAPMSPSAPHSFGIFKLARFFSQINLMEFPIQLIS